MWQRIRNPTTTVFKMLKGFTNLNINDYITIDESNVTRYKMKGRRIFDGGIGEYGGTFHFSVLSLYLRVCSIELNSLIRTSLYCILGEGLSGYCVVMAGILVMVVVMNGTDGDNTNGNSEW